MDQSTDTNRTRTEHLSLSAVTIESKDLVIYSAQLGDKIIVEANQASTSIDRRRNGDWDFLFGSRKSGNEMSVDFGRNVDEKITMNPSKTIRSTRPQVTRTILINCNIFDSVIRVLPWYGTMKSESENLV